MIESVVASSYLGLLGGLPGRQPDVLAAIPVRLIVPTEPLFSAWWEVLSVVCLVGTGVLLTLSALCLWVWLGDRRRSTDACDRAFRSVADRLGLGSAQRAVVVRLAGHIDGGMPPVSLLLSTTVLRRAVAAEMETKPGSSAVREITRLVERLAGELPGSDGSGETPQSPRTLRDGGPSRDE
ncbi:MAG: hypothetical protein KF787_04100 [Phycisphaeraceae bacterium]|nr:hypothetical protein [Phycisphaeraceae bacterium]